MVKNYRLTLQEVSRLRKLQSKKYSTHIENNKDFYSASIPKFKGALQYREKLNKYLKIKNNQTKNFQTDQRLKLIWNASAHQSTNLLHV